MLYLPVDPSQTDIVFNSYYKKITSHTSEMKIAHLRPENDREDDDYHVINKSIYLESLLCHRVNFNQIRP